jgi:hypothetical protein
MAADRWPMFVRGLGGEFSQERQCWSDAGAAKHENQRAGQGAPSRQLATGRINEAAMHTHQMSFLIIEPRQDAIARQNAVYRTRRAMRA